MKVEFYFDPSCPFTWITSRWLLRVQEQRNITVVWKPFSLALKNDELGGGGDSYAESHRVAHRVLRVMLAAVDKGASLADFYTAIGAEHHINDREYDNDLIREMLTKFELPLDLMAAADDNNYDGVIQESIDSALELTGKDVGVPIITFVGKDGSRNGFFGPVLQALPGHEESLKIWDGLSQLGSSEHFYELKRSRPEGAPDVASTAG